MWAALQAVLLAEAISTDSHRDFGLSQTIEWFTRGLSDVVMMDY